MEGYKKMNIMASLVLFLAVVMFTGCSARKGVPYDEPVTLETEQLKQGQVLFHNACNSCHPGGSGGLGPAINNKLLPQFLIRFQIRHGLGTMPSFKEEALTDQEVKNIAAYLVHLRKKG